MSEKPTVALVLHGGAGARRGRNYTITEQHLHELTEKGEKQLRDGASSADVIEGAVKAMEESGYYIAGRGAAPNKAGYTELDASIMVGAEQPNPNENEPFKRRAGAVAAVANLKSPIEGARAVMDETPHVMLAGRGAENFCRAKNLAFIDNPDEYYITPIGLSREDTLKDDLSHGTVGAVALDLKGQLAAATSTGGVFGKLEGRVGDTPLIGSGTWADEYVAASCTGIGEYFILAGGAQDIAARVRYRGESLQIATQALIDDVGRLGGDGGVIAVSRTGEIAVAWNSKGMKRAGIGPSTPLFSDTF